MEARATASCAKTARSKTKRCSDSKPRAARRASRSPRPGARFSSPSKTASSRSARAISRERPKGSRGSPSRPAVARAWISSNREGVSARPRSSLHSRSSASCGRASRRFCPSRDAAGSDLLFGFVHGQPCLLEPVFATSRLQVGEERSPERGVAEKYEKSVARGRIRQGDDGLVTDVEHRDRRENGKDQVHEGVPLGSLLRRVVPNDTDVRENVHR